VAAKTPLVQFRGQWMELDRDHMQQLLEFWQTRKAANRVHAPYRRRTGG